MRMKRRRILSGICAPPRMDWPVGSPFAAVRITRRERSSPAEAPVFVSTNQYIFRFRTSCVPSSYLYYNKRLLLTPYIYKVKKCEFCQRFGHTKVACKQAHDEGKRVCEKCGKVGHGKSSTNPGEECINCIRTKYGSLSHQASAVVCPAFKRQREINRLMAYRDLLYKDAFRLYDGGGISDRDEDHLSLSFTTVPLPSLAEFWPTTPSNKANNYIFQFEAGKSFSSSLSARSSTGGDTKMSKPSQKHKSREKVSSLPSSGWKPTTYAKVSGFQPRPSLTCDLLLIKKVVNVRLVDIRTHQSLP